MKRIEIFTEILKEAGVKFTPEIEKRLKRFTYSVNLYNHVFPEKEDLNQELRELRLIFNLKEA